MATTNPQITRERSREALPGTFPGDLGIEVVEITDELARGRMAVDRRHLHPGGYVHGGCLDGVRRHRRRLGNVPPPAAGHELHDGRDEDQRLRGGGRAATC